MPWKKSNSAAEYKEDVLYVPKSTGSPFSRLGIKTRGEIRIMVVPKPHCPRAKEFIDLLEEEKLLINKKWYPLLEYKNKNAIKETDIKDIQKFLAIINKFERFDDNEQTEVFQLIENPLDHFKEKKEQPQGIKLETSSPKLPNLIFAERHTDDVTFKILTKLLPLLQGLYTSYYDEYPNELSLSNKMDDIEYRINEVSKLQEKFREMNLDLFSEEDRYIYSANLPTKEEALAFHKKINVSISYFASNLACREFLHSLEKYKIRYRAIDDTSSQLLLSLISGTESSDILMTSIFLTLQSRDKCMANAYLTSSSPVLGKIGIGHAEGIQKEILNNISPQEAKSKFLFFYIHSKSKHDNENSNTLPLGIIEINASDKSVEEVVEKIYQIIKQANRPLTTPLPQQKETKSKISNYPSLFQNFIFDIYRAPQGTRTSASMSPSTPLEEEDNQNDTPLKIVG